MRRQIVVDTHSPAYPTAFGRGWIPQSRDIGLPPGEVPVVLNSAGANGAGACPAANHNAWTPRRKAAFLHFLAETGNVRAAAARVGISFQSAYVMRRRDPVFGEGWAAALVLARDHVEQVLATRALDGVEEGVYYHGQPVAVRRRYDSRLLLAHLARLDQLAYETRAGDAALRFDELLALVAGEQPHEDMIDFGGGDPDAPGPVLPLARETYAETAAIRAQHRAEDDDDYGDDAEADGFDEDAFGAEDADGGAPAPDEPGYWDYHAVALADWDAWQAHAFATVDALAAGFAGDGSAVAGDGTMDPRLRGDDEGGGGGGGSGVDEGEATPIPVAPAQAGAQPDSPPLTEAAGQRGRASRRPQDEPPTGAGDGTMDPRLRGDDEGGRDDGGRFGEEVAGGGVDGDDGGEATPIPVAPAQAGVQPDSPPLTEAAGQCRPASRRKRDKPPMEFKSLAFLRPEPRQLRQPTARAARSGAGRAGVRNALAGEALGSVKAGAAHPPSLPLPRRSAPFAPHHKCSSAVRGGGLACDSHRPDGVDAGAVTEGIAMSRMLITLAACAAVAALPGTALAAPAKLAATLAGANETAGGDTDGSGAFAGEMDVDTGDVCFTLTVAKLGKVTAAHIHKGAAGADGDPVAPLSVTGPDGDTCIAAEPDLLKAIVAAPADYYVNVHTADFPKGAVRGQLAAK
jgi:hypothetical protein